MYIGCISTQLLLGPTQAMRDMDRRKAEIAIPVVAIHGTADHTTSLVAVKALLKECVSPDATLKEYQGAHSYL